MEKIPLYNNNFMGVFMVEYIKARETVENKIKKCKKKCFRVFRKEYKILLLCWFITAVFTFAAWGIYFLFKFAGFLLELPLDILGASIGIFTVLPIFAGNVSVSKNAVLGRKTDVYPLFDGYFYFKKFWKWFFLLIVSISPSWLVSLCFAVVSEETNRFFPFLQGKSLFYFSVVFEIATVVSVFFSLCKTLYFFSLYKKDDSSKEFFDIAERGYLKRKKYFKRYMLSNLPLILILVFARVLPLFVETLVFIFVLGYFSLSTVSFSFQFNANGFFCAERLSKGERLRLKKIDFK